MSNILYHLTIENLIHNIDNNEMLMAYILQIYLPLIKREFMTHRINVMHALVKFHEYIPYSLGVMARTQLTIWNLVKGKLFQNQKRKSYGPDTVNYMEPSQGEIIPKPKTQELSSLFMTHRDACTGKVS